MPSEHSDACAEIIGVGRYPAAAVRLCPLVSFRVAAIATFRVVLLHNPKLTDIQDINYRVLLIPVVIDFEDKSHA